jgi:CDP-diacylglycerol--serine O-phosphatidyltransferase
MSFRFRPRFKPRKKRLRHVAVLPTLMTLGNALCGFGAIACVAEGPQFFERAAWLILLAMVFDALDGRLARMTGSASNFGAQLDSLSDMVTFGVAPVVLVMQVMTNPLPVLQTKLVWLICALYVACAALRLARFNVETTPDEAAHDHFRGFHRPGPPGSSLPSFFCMRTCSPIRQRAS